MCLQDVAISQRLQFRMKALVVNAANPVRVPYNPAAVVLWVVGSDGSFQRLYHTGTAAVGLEAPADTTMGFSGNGPVYSVASLGPLNRLDLWAANAGSLAGMTLFWYELDQATYTDSLTLLEKG